MGQGKILLTTSVDMNTRNITTKGHKPGGKVYHPSDITLELTREASFIGPKAAKEILRIILAARECVLNVGGVGRLVLVKT